MLINGVDLQVCWKILFCCFSLVICFNFCFVLGGSKDGSVPGLSKGVGFIRFDQRVEAERAITKLNGTIPEGQGLLLQTNLLH